MSKQAAAAGSILVTGGTGYFGRAFVAMLLEQGISQRICVYSRGEHAQAEMREALGNPPEVRWFIGDVRDRDRLRRAMWGVDWVVHAAALKRIEVGAYNPDEMVKTNIDGTRNVIEAAHEMLVRKVLLISSDKAWQPISAYGQSKALAESLILAANNMQTTTKFAVVRYGNVANSTGSVIPRWRAILKKTEHYFAADRPDTVVPITDPNCTRFWMTAQEACKLVLDTLRTMQGGELITPILPAYRLEDLADAMGIKHLTVTGLPSHEKLHEGMGPMNTSDIARRMSVDELREALQSLPS